MNLKFKINTIYCKKLHIIIKNLSKHENYYKKSEKNYKTLDYLFQTEPEEKGE